MKLLKTFLLFLLIFFNNQYSFSRCVNQKYTKIFISATAIFATLYTTKQRWLPFVYACDKNAHKKVYKKKYFLKKILSSVTGIVSDYSCKELLHFNVSTFYKGLFTDYNLNTIDDLSFLKRIQWWKKFMALEKMLKNDQELFTSLYNGHTIVAIFKNDFDYLEPVVGLLSFNHKNDLKSEEYEKISCIQKFLDDLENGFCLWLNISKPKDSLNIKNFAQEQSKKMKSILSSYESIKNSTIQLSPSLEINFNNLKSSCILLTNSQNNLEQSSQTKDLLKNIDALYKTIDTIEKNKDDFFKLDIISNKSFSHEIIKNFSSHKMKLFIYKIIFETRCKIIPNNSEDENNLEKPIKIILDELKEFIVEIKNKTLTIINSKINSLSHILSEEDFYILKEQVVEYQTALENMNLDDIKNSYELIQKYLEFFVNKIKPYASIHYLPYLDPKIRLLEDDDNAEVEKKPNIKISYHIQNGIILPDDISKALKIIQNESCNKEILKNLTRKYHSDKRNNTMSEDATQREIYARFINELLNIISTYISHVEGKEYDVQVGISIHVEFLKTKTAIDYKISPRK